MLLDFDAPTELRSTRELELEMRLISVIHSFNAQKGELEKANRSINGTKMSAARFKTQLNRVNLENEGLEVELKKEKELRIESEAELRAAKVAIRLLLDGKDGL